MTTLATVWLALVLLFCVFAWHNIRLRLLALPVAAAVVAVAVYIPTGTPRFTAPPEGKYAVVGVKIDIDKAIYVLLDNGSAEPTYYVLPYSAGKASQLQDAKDTAGENGQVSVEINGEGGGEFRGEPPVTGTDDKVAEQPEIQIGE